jgi:opacity protein-like surface antigen
MKKNLFLFSIVLSLFAVNSFAADNAPDTSAFLVNQPKPQVSIFSGAGPYVGVEGGLARADEGTALNDFATSFSNYDTTQGGFGYRIYAGFNIIRFFSIETGYNGFPDNSYDASLGKTDFNSSVSTWSWDIMGKFILPINMFVPRLNLDLYAKFGAAYVSSDIKDAMTGKDYSNSGWEPAYGLGVQYNFNKYIAANVEWYGTWGSNLLDSSSDDPSKVIPSTNAIALGLIFKLPVVK